jgi:hypothetical protein
VVWSFCWIVLFTFVMFNQAGATEITETLLIPELPVAASVSRVSILGVGSDMMTTFLSFDPDTKDSTTLIGMNFSPYSSPGLN